MNEDLYTVLIIGCGNIAGGYDLHLPEEDLPLGHAKAFINHGGFKLVACIDPDASKLAAFQNRWGVPNGFTSFKDMGAPIFRFDVISICSPTREHANDLQLALSLNPKLIFCEKPVTSILQDTVKAVKDCSDQKVLLAVNYSRRWSPQVMQLKFDLINGKWGEVRSVSAVYNKGILNNGSHMLDLLNCLFGPLKLTSVGHLLGDFFPEDPTVDATLISDHSFPIHLNVAHAKDYALFEMKIVTEKGVIDMEDGGARWRFRLAQPSNKLYGYNFLNAGEWVVSNGSYSLTGAVANLYDALQSKVPLASTGINSLQAQSICEQIKRCALSKAEDQNFKKEVS